MQKEQTKGRPKRKEAHGKLLKAHSWEGNSCEAGNKEKTERGMSVYEMTALY